MGDWAEANEVEQERVKRYVRDLHGSRRAK